MHAEGVNVLHRADRNAGPLRVAHHLVLNLLPADQAALHHHLANGARAQAAADAFPVLLLRHHDPTTRPTEREGWAHDRRESDLRECRRRRRVTRRGRLPFNDRAWCRWLSDSITHCPEELAILRRLDRRKRRAEEANRMSFKDASIGECNGKVECRLSAESSEQTLWLFKRNDAFDHLHRERLKVDRIRNGWVGHDRCRI